MSAAPHDWIEHARTALVESLRAAADGFPRAGEDAPERIHDVRKEFKRAAALARLFAPIVGAPAYAALETVNAARRRVGQARDLDILPGVLASLKVPAEIRLALTRAIASARGEARQAHADADVEEIVEDLRARADDIVDWDLEGREVEALLASLRGVYRSAKRRGRVAFATADADELHDLRQRVVDLGHQCALFEAAWPAMFAAYGDELHKLRQALGDHNDLTVLGEFALSRRELPAEAAETLVALVLRRRKPLEKRAAENFERLFAERPGAFERRLGGYLAHPRSRPAITAAAPAKVADKV